VGGAGGLGPHPFSPLLSKAFLQVHLLYDRFAAEEVSGQLLLLHLLLGPASGQLGHAKSHSLLGSFPSVGHGHRIILKKEKRSKYLHIKEHYN